MNAQIAEGTPGPVLSVIIAAYNDWAPLDRCLRSLSEQKGAPSFEAVVVDDGSADPPPGSVFRWRNSYPLTVVQQSHSGVSTARNRGIQASNGAVLVFVDADCQLQIDCLSALASEVARCPQYGSYQLRLVGDLSTLAGKAEELRLRTLQGHFLRSDRCIRYLNTAGFAIRREKVHVENGLFDPAAVRAEDTLLLVRLMQAGELPLFVSDAVVQHTISLTLMECFRKDIRSAYLGARTYETIQDLGFSIRMGHRERLRMAWSMWKTSAQAALGRGAWMLLMTRQTLERAVSFAYVFRRAKGRNNRKFRPGGVKSRPR